MSFTSTTPCVENPSFSDLATASDEVQHLWSDREGNRRAPWREVSLHRSLQMFVPLDTEQRPVQGAGESRFYVAPGEPAYRGSRRSFTAHRACLEDPTKKFPCRIEIEFSSPCERTLSVPRAYRKSAVDWALRECNAVVICIDRERGRAEGEAHRVVAPVQVVFRCREQDVGTWHAFLKPRLHARHRLSIVHLAAGRA